jgi:hypothetical protein
VQYLSLHATLSANTSGAVPLHSTHRLHYSIRLSTNLSITPSLAFHVWRRVAHRPWCVYLRTFLYTALEWHLLPDDWLITGGRLNPDTDLPLSTAWIWWHSKFRVCIKSYVSVPRNRRSNFQFRQGLHVRTVGASVSACRPQIRWLESDKSGRIWKEDHCLLQVRPEDVPIGTDKPTAGSSRWEADSSSPSHTINNSPYLIKFKDSLPRSQQPATGPHSEPDKPNPQPPVALI